MKIVKKVAVFLSIFLIIFSSTALVAYAGSVTTVDFSLNTRFNDDEISVDLGIERVDDGELVLCNIQTDLQFDNDNLVFSGYALNNSNLNGITVKQLSSDLSKIRVFWYDDAVHIDGKDKFITLKFKTNGTLCNKTVDFSIDANKSVVTDENYNGCIFNRILYKQSVYIPHRNVVDVPEKKPTPISSGYKSGGFCKLCNEWVDGGEKVNKLSLGNPSFSLNGGNGSVTVKLKLGKYANGVVIYYKVAGSDKWKEKAVYNPKGSVVLKNLSKTVYQIKLCSAYRSGNQSVKGKCTSVRTVATIAVPKVTYSSAKKKITVKCGKVSGAAGYQICYRKNGKGKWTVKSYKSKGKITKSFKLSSKKKYQFRVRAFSSKGKAIVYTEYTKSKTVKTK